MAQLHLFLKPQQCSDASATLGGIKVFALSEERLLEEMKRVSDAINSCARQHLCTSKPFLAKLLREFLGVNELDRRLSSALVGWQLRMGQLDTTLCDSAASKTFWIVIHREQLERFAKSVNFADGLLLHSTSIAVRELELALFNRRAPGTWSSAFYVLARLAYLGRAEYGDNNTFHVPRGMHNAFREAAQ